MVKRGILFVMTGASGVGKDSIRHQAMPRLRGLHYSVSATTRARRSGEVEGRNYFFYDKERFAALIDGDGFLEYAEYVGDFYGTPRAAVEEHLAQGEDVLLEVELAGARQVKQAMPEAIMIFIAPPSLQELEARLRGRGSDSEEKIQKRLARAKEEITAIPEFDYVIVNNLLEDAVDNFYGIICAERSKTKLFPQEAIEAILSSA